MKIAYRRMSGKVGLTDFEDGSRGAWLEKRKALLLTLRERGHEVDVVSPLTKYGGYGRPYGAEHELLMIEFGSSNTSFYGKDLQETAAIYRRHPGPVVFLCDDPDLPFHAWVGHERQAPTYQWLNCTRPAPLQSPDWVVNLDMPFSALQKPRTAAPFTGDRPEHLVYIGRPSGRAHAFRRLIAAQFPFVVHAKASEWKGFAVDVRNLPEQRDRSDFYNRQLGCLAVADAKHKRYGWRTGRAYHAALAGCPVLGELDHPGFTDFAQFDTVDQAFTALELFRRQRARVVEGQMLFLEHDRAIADQTFVRCGL